LLDQPLAESEFLAVDTETNGLNGDLCEMTEVGAVLVGGGELHETWESLTQTERPLQRGIQRFTGITQAMVDTAPPPAEVLPELAEWLEGRVLVAHNARFDDRVLRGAFERQGLDWPDPPVVCTVALARRFAPLIRRRGLASLADALGIEVDEVHRALPDALTCARVFCALFPKLCANAPTVGAALDMLAPRRRRSRAREEQEGKMGDRLRTMTSAGGTARRRPPEDRPDLSKLPDDPGVYVFRDERGRPLYVGKSVSLRSRARSHFCAPAGWTEKAEIVDYRPTNSELGALVLENRLIKQWQPQGNRKLKRTDGYVYLRCRLESPYPILEVGPEPAAGRAVNVGPLKGRKAAGELADQLTSLFRLRHCGKALPRRDSPSAYGQMGRCLSPCLGDLDPNAYRGQVDKALDLFSGPDPDAASRLLGHVEEQMREASAARRYERAATLRRRAERLERVLGRLDGVLRAVHAAPQLVIAPHPAKERYDVFWLVDGRVADWGPLPGPSELAERTAAALRRRSRRGPSHLPPEEVDEVRIVSAWLADHDAPRLSLAHVPAPEELSEWSAHATAGATR
jgi:DNA polymerase-3 subunit epsilon